LDNSSHFLAHPLGYFYPGKMTLKAADRWPFLLARRELQTLENVITD
jgi:hypothetical protein